MTSNWDPEMVQHPRSCPVSRILRGVGAPSQVYASVQFEEMIILFHATFLEEDTPAQFPRSGKPQAKHSTSHGASGRVEAMRWRNFPG